MVSYGVTSYGDNRMVQLCMVQLLAHTAVIHAYEVRDKVVVIFLLPSLQIYCANLITKQLNIPEPSNICDSQDGHRDSYSVVMALAC